MPRTVSRSILASQAAMLRRIVASEVGGVPKSRIAEAAGVDGSIVSKWDTDGTDPREMTWDQARRLADAFGWDVVMGAPATAAGFVVAPEQESGDVRRLVRDAVRTTRATAEFSEAVSDALADGVITDEEAADLEQRQLQLMAHFRRLSVRVSAGRVAS